MRGPVPSAAWWSASGDGEDERQYPRCTGLAEQPGRDRHGPATVDAVVDDQHRATKRGHRVGQRPGEPQLTPDRLQALRAVELPGSRTVSRVLQGAEQRQTPDLRDPLAQAGDEAGAGAAREGGSPGPGVVPRP